MCRIHSVKNLKKAVHKSQLGKKKKYGCIKYNKHRKENFLALKEMLVNGTFHTSPYKTFTIVQIRANCAIFLNCLIFLIVLCITQSLTLSSLDVYVASYVIHFVVLKGVV